MVSTNKRYPEEYHVSTQGLVELLLEDFMNGQIELSEWELDFLEDMEEKLKNENPYPTDKQDEKIKQIYNDKY